MSDRRVFSSAWIYAYALEPTFRRLRAEKGWSHEDYADRARIHWTYVSGIKRGKRNPTITVVEKLAKPLGAKTGDLLDRAFGAETADS